MDSKTQRLMQEVVRAAWLTNRRSIGGNRQMNQQAFADFFLERLNLLGGAGIAPHLECTAKIDKKGMEHKVVAYDIKLSFHIPEFILGKLDSERGEIEKHTLARTK